MTRDAYVPLTPSIPENTSAAAVQYNRFRLRVATLDQVRDVQEVIQKMMEHRHPDQNFRVSSPFPEGE